MGRLRGLFESGHPAKDQIRVRYAGFGDDYRKEITDSLDYPPQASPGVERD